MRVGRAQGDYQEFRARLGGLTDQSMAAVKRSPKRNGADQVGRDVDAVELAQMADNHLAGAHAAGVHRDDLVVEPRKLALVFGDQLRIEPGLMVARHLQFDLPGIGDDRLLAKPHLGDDVELTPLNRTRNGLGKDVLPW